MTDTFRCYLVEKDDKGALRGGVAERPIDALPAGDVVVRVAYSSLNYKDALSAAGNPGAANRCLWAHAGGLPAGGTRARGRVSANAASG